MLSMIPAFSARRQAAWKPLAVLCVLCFSAALAAQEAAESQSPAAMTYPTAGLLPKNEIGALRFLEKYPEFDGRGVVVAIFDTGVDPGAPGLQTTSDGKPKIVDMVDGTGSGDVPMIGHRTADDMGQIEGLSGRMLTLPEQWLSKTREFRVGLKAGYELFPPELVARLRERRKELFMREHAKLEAQLRRELAEWDEAYPDASAEQKGQREELEKRLEQLRHMAEHYEDPGPIYDCVTFHDGEVWRAAVDTNEDGQFADEKALANFSLEHEYATFRGEADLNFGVNIYNDGALLSLVADCGPHGTHVAGIVAAHFPEQPELNGIAPGAQIIAVKIGDPRTLEMENESGMTRAIVAAMRAKCDLINMSFGEPSRTPNKGLIADMMTRAVNEHGIIFVSSAGNAGPALSTVGAPGGTLTASIGVGAYVTPSLMESAYALRETLPEMPYTWTSRGPTFDGAMGVSICAPGGAIAPVPNWTQQRTMRMNGTSMASPNACGGIALILSGLKQQNIAYTPQSIRRALENTARPLEDVHVFAQGAGVVQVPTAFEYLVAHAAAPAELTGISVSTGQQQRGIYLREPAEIERVQEIPVHVRPQFREDAPSAERVGFELRLALRSTAPWVRSGKYLLLTHGEESFQVLVDPTHLESGEHYAEIQGFDVQHPERGPLLRVPVTAVVPREPNAEAREIELRPGQVDRQFLAVPEGARWADLVIERLDAGPPGRFMLQAVQRHPGLNYRDRQMQAFITIPADGTETRSFAVTGGLTLEFCLAQFWSSLGETRLRCSLTFRSEDVSPAPIVLAQGDAPRRLELGGAWEPRRLSPRASLKTWRRTLAPTKAELKVSTDPRDQAPDGSTMHQLVLTYEFERHAGSSVTIRFPQTDDWLYDSPMAGHLWMLFDPAKRHIATDDIWPSAVTVGPGKHTLRLQLRHPSAATLEAYKTAPVQLDSPLPSSIALKVSESRWEDDKKPSGILRPGERRAMYVHPPAPSALPSGLRPGDQLLGTLEFADAIRPAQISADIPDGHSVQWFAAFEPASSQASSAPDAETSDEEQEKLAEQREAVAQLHRLDTDSERTKRLDDIVAAADHVIATIDKNALAQTLGTRAMEGDQASQQERRRAESQRDVLADALHRKARALLLMELPEVMAERPIEAPEAHGDAIEATFRELARWVDVTSRPYVLLAAQREQRRENWGAALELLNKHLRSSAPNQQLFDMRLNVLDQLGWEPWVEYNRAWRTRQFPDEFTPF